MKTHEQLSIFADALPVELEPETPEISNVMVTNQRIDKKSRDLILDVRATSSTMNVPLITKEVLAKGFLRAVVEYMGNDISAVMDELIIIYARQSVIAEINKIVAEGDKPDTKQFETMVQQRIWEIRHTLVNYQQFFSPLWRERENEYKQTKSEPELLQKLDDLPNDLEEIA